MFMAKDEWSEDELDDLDDSTVVPISNLPTPQVISSGGPSAGGIDTQLRAAAYNERMARARQATRKSSSSGAHASHTPSAQECSCRLAKPSPSGRYRQNDRARLSSPQA